MVLDSFKNVAPVPLASGSGTPPYITYGMVFFIASRTLVRVPRCFSPSVLQYAVTTRAKRRVCVCVDMLTSLLASVAAHSVECAVLCRRCVHVHVCAFRACLRMILVFINRLYANAQQRFILIRVATAEEIKAKPYDTGFKRKLIPTNAGQTKCNSNLSRSHCQQVALARHHLAHPTTEKSN